MYVGPFTIRVLSSSRQSLRAPHTVSSRITTFLTERVYSSGSNSTLAPIKSSQLVVDTMPALNVPVIEDVIGIENPDVTDVLCQPKVHIRDRGLVHDKLKRMISDGADKLMIISDFDFTLSRFEDDDGARCWTTHGVFDNCATEVDPTLGGKFTELRDKYFPIEFDPKLSDEEKIPHMEAWWSTSHSHIVNAGFLKSTIEKFVSHSKIVLRDGTEDMINHLVKRSVPFVVFSAGIGNIIEIFFEQKLGSIPSNTHIISNMMEFNSDNRVCSFSEPLIHTFCKNSSVIRKEAGFFHEVSGRTNVILLGDSMGDIHMDVGVEKDGPTLKIGFLNSNEENLLDHYMDVYDIVIVKDQTMTVPGTLINAILKSV